MGSPVLKNRILGIQYQIWSLQSRYVEACQGLNKGGFWVHLKKVARKAEKGYKTIYTGRLCTYGGNVMLFLPFLGVIEQDHTEQGI